MENSKVFWLVCTIKEDGKFYAHAVKAPQRDNLKTILDRIKNLSTVEIFNTREQAVRMVEFLNDTYKQNGTYMFAEPF